MGARAASEPARRTTAPATVIGGVAYTLGKEAALRGVRGLIAAAALAAAGAAIFSAPSEAAQQPADHGKGTWSVVCPFQHRSPDDPIVFPAQPGASHLHDFIGNPTTSAHSTRQRLRRAGDSTCTRFPDRSAYWVPSLLAGSSADRVVPLRPIAAKIYYRAARRNPQTIRPFPRGLRMVVGSSRAQAPQEGGGIGWFCKGRGGTGDPNVVSPAPPICEPGERLRSVIAFPDCSDGRTDSHDHMSHMAFATRQPGDRWRKCPSSHPLPVPFTALTVIYPTSPGIFSLSSGSEYSLHADFFEAWRRKSLKRLIDRCIVADYTCSTRGTPQGNDGRARDGRGRRGRGGRRGNGRGNRHR